MTFKMRYLLSFVGLVIVASLIFQFVRVVFQHISPEYRDNLLCVALIAVTPIILITIYNPGFWKKHVNGSSVLEEISEV